MKTVRGAMTTGEREDVAHERRHWVRISRTCNNHCSFCLDSDMQDGTFIPREEVEKAIDLGIAGGASRLILSGGEASINPDFVALIGYGKRRGYGLVQTITNGRMFAYEQFARNAIDAGLGEITFSMHGHTPDLHDSLTGVPGSFLQAVAGIRNVVRDGRCIVSGDVVVNRRNVEHLRSILDLFIELGIREIDILMVVPFGRASPGLGEGMLLDLAEQKRHLDRALELAAKPGIHLWTNRMDPRLLEGREELIQDPHKLHDEVHGRIEILRDLAAGRAMRCEGDRCSHCFIHGLCKEMRDAARQVASGVPGILRIDVSSGTIPAEAAMALAGLPRRVLWVRADDAAGAIRVASLARAEAIWIEASDLRGVRQAVSRSGNDVPLRLVADGAAALASALRAGPEELMIFLDSGTAPMLAKTKPPEGTRIILSLHPAPSMKEARSAWANPRETPSVSRIHAFAAIPPCLCGSTSVTWEDPVDASSIGEDGLVDPEAFVDHFVAWRYRTKSLRCLACIHDGSCLGLAVNHVRHAGYGVLEPVAK